MKTWDLNAGAAKLEMAIKTLREANGNIAEAWDDETSRRFQETYVEPVEPRLKNVLDAVHRLAEVLAGAARECGDRDHD
jgi:uncharacterized protein YukE